MIGKLGKLPPKHDARTLRLANYIDLAKLPPIPAVHKWSTAVATPIGMMKNDSVGDCAYATFGHAEQVWTANAGKEWTPSDNDVITAYSAGTGFDPKQTQSDGSNPTDQGAVLLDVLNQMRKTGIAGHKIGAFAAIDLKNRVHVEAAVYLFGGVAIGLNLPLSAQAQVGKLWKVPFYGARWNGAPGSWGGHAVFTPDHSKVGPACATWGEWQAMTWSFWARYCDECFAILSPDWVSPDKKAPSGFDLATLQSDLAEVTK